MNYQIEKGLIQALDKLNRLIDILIALVEKKRDETPKP